MKLKLKKQHLKTLSNDSKKLPKELTPAVAGGIKQIETNPQQCDGTTDAWGCTGGACTSACG